MAMRIVKGMSDGDINAFNQWMRSQPWYQTIVAQYGGHANNDAAKAAIVRAAQQNGAQVDEGNMEVDDSGNFREKGHKLRNAAIIGGLAAGAVFGVPALAGAFGAGAAPAAEGVTMLAGAPEATSVGMAAGAAGGASGWGSILGGGSTLGKIAGAARGVAPILSKAAGSAAQENTAQAGLNLRGQESRDQMALGKANAQLGRDQFALTAPTTRMNRSVKASLLNNYTPAQIHWGGPGSGLQGQIPTVTGGYMDGLSHLDPDTQALLKQVMADDLASQMKGGTTGGGADDQLDLPANFGEYDTQIPESGGEKWLGRSALLASVLGGL